MQRKLSPKIISLNMYVYMNIVQARALYLREIMNCIIVVRGYVGDVIFVEICIEMCDWLNFLSHSSLRQLKWASEAHSLVSLSLSSHIRKLQLENFTMQAFIS